MKLSFSTILVLAGLLGCQSTPPRPTAVTQGDYATVTRYLSSLISKEMDKGDVTGLSIALVDDQKIVWAQGFGYADKAHNRPATAETLYRVGSISKLFTATAAMQLAEQRKLDIDKPLRTYVPEFSVKPRVGNLEITPRNIMTHHSGLSRDYLSGMWTSQPKPFSELASKLDAESAAYPPEYLFSYSNIGVSLLGHAVQNVSGQAFEQYMQENVLHPIGMANSTFSSRVAKESLMSQGYRDNKLANEPALRDVPAGGLNTNVLDLSRFLSMVFADGKVGEHVILKSTTLHEMLQAQNEGIALDLNFQIGLGWMLSGLGDIAIENAGKVVHHAGSTFMFHSQMIALPDHKLGVVVLSNSATSAPAVNKVAVEALKLALQAKTGIKSDSPPKLIVSEEKIDDETARAFAGDYATMLGFLHVDRSGEDLLANAAGAIFTLVPRKNGTLGVHYVLLGFIPISLGDEIERIGLLRRSIAGRDVLVAQIGKQQMLVGEKIKPVPLSEEWQQRLGEYEVANLNDDESMIEHFELTQENGFLLSEISLTLQPSMTYRLPIIPVTDSKANVATMLHDYGETVNVVTNNGEEQLQFAGYILQKKRMRRSIIDDSFKSRRE